MSHHDDTTQGLSIFVAIYIQLNASAWSRKAVMIPARPVLPEPGKHTSMTGLTCTLAGISPERRAVFGTGLKEHRGDKKAGMCLE